MSASSAARTTTRTPPGSSGSTPAWLPVPGLHEDAYGPSTIRGGFVMPRVGIEGGGEHVRIWFSIEVVLGYGHAVDVQDPGTPPVDARGFTPGVNYELGFTVR